ncbi:MAG: hypothetical protein QXH63_02475 [Pyrobaculum sp.]
MCVDLLGRRVAVYKCPYKTVGIVVGETHNIVYIDTGLKIVKIPKALCYFYIYDLQKLVHGSRLLGYRDRRLFNC